MMHFHDERYHQETTLSCNSGYVLFEISTLEIYRPMPSDPTSTIIPGVVLLAKNPSIEIRTGREAGDSAQITHPIDNLEKNKAGEKVLSG
jgi:hypothetical protein